MILMPGVHGLVFKYPLPMLLGVGEGQGKGHIQTVHCGEKNIRCRYKYLSWFGYGDSPNVAELFHYYNSSKHSVS